MDDSMARSVLVTGAAEGIGYAVAARFAAAGDRVALLDLDEAKLTRAVERLRSDGYDVFGTPVDVREAATVERAADMAAERYGRLDVAVSNAGVYPSGPVLTLEEAEWDRVLDTNLKGTFLLTRAVARRMIAQPGPAPWANSRGKIVTMASGAARSARVGAAHYCASKAGVVLYSQALALELAEHRINVNIVSPGFVDVGDRPVISPEYRAAITRAIPWGRAGGPDDIARAVFFLCSEEAEFMTGAVVPVDGGSSAGRYGLPLS